MRLFASPLLFLFVLASCSAAWPQEFHQLEGLMLRRQDSDQSSSSSSSKSASASKSVASSSDASSTDSSSTDSSKSTITDSASASGSQASSSDSAAATTGASGSKETASASKTDKSSSKPPKTTDFDPRLPPGGVQMVTPAATEGSQYYKVGDFVTFKWNYTSLSVTPSAIDVMASCSENHQMYTIALNQSVDATGAVTWDTGKYQKTASIPLVVETYTLVIYDAAQDATATAKAGYLGSFNQFQFGMYTPQEYTPLNEFTCATCNGALSEAERHALGFMLIMATITTLSFTWFAGGFGVFS